MLTPGHLTTSQSEECPWPHLTPHHRLPHPLKSYPESHRAVQAFETWVALTPCISSYNKHHTLLHHNLISEDWLSWEGRVDPSLAQECCHHMKSKGKVSPPTLSNWVEKSVRKSGTEKGSPVSAQTPACSYLILLPKWSWSLLLGFSHLVETSQERGCDSLQAGGWIIKEEYSLPYT